MVSTRKISADTVRTLGITSNLPKRQLAIVSPCSTCRNFTAAQDENDKFRPTCPRRFWIDTVEQMGDENSYPDYLSESGTDDLHKLINPVHSEANATIFTWVAIQENNRGVVDESGSQLAVGILHPDFDPEKDSKYLQCEQLPYVPEDHQASLFQQGVLHEMDQVYVESFHSEQLDPAGESVWSAGTLKKASFPFNFSLLSARRDNNPAGC